MINLRNIFLIILCGFIISCGTEKKEQTADTQAPESLTGTWQLKQRIYQQGGDEPELINASDTMIYNKNLTDTHFTWIQYDKKNDVLRGIGGGTYDYDGSNYVEHIGFFMPLEAGILGQSVNFTAKFKNGEWYHTGYTKEIEFDPEVAQMVVGDSNKIDEIWTKVEGGVNTENITGTWELQELKSSPEALPFSYPDFINYVKLITPTHFVWVQYNDDGDEVSGAGAGTYSYSGDEYRETIEMMYPSGNGLLGGEVVFKCEIDDNRWSHYCTSFEMAGASTDTIYIDEKWARFGSI